MGKVKVNQVDVFTTRPDSGNPAGVVDDLQESSLTKEQMQAIAQAAGFSESVFILKSKRADVKLRYFMTAKETPCAVMPPLERLTICGFNRFFKLN